MKTRTVLLLALPLLLAAQGGCSEKCDRCPDCETGEDAPLDDGVAETEEDPVEEEVQDVPAEEAPGCFLPDIACEAGNHPEYGQCVPDANVVAVPAGSFTMGTDGGEDNPTHSVNLSAFTIDRFEVTVSLYQSCVEAGCCTPPQYDGSYTGRQPYYGNDEFAGYPVIFVDWNQAQAYCEGIGKSLPTEAQWEKAARGEDGRTYPWGNDLPAEAYLNYSSPIDGDTMEVGTHPAGASPYGAEDMAGNVWEWTADWYDPAYYGSSPADDPTGPATGVAKVARGGSFASLGTPIRTYSRDSYHPMEAFATMGFRCAGE